MGRIQKIKEPHNPCWEASFYPPLSPTSAVV
jgi:hypothetical protein